MEIDIFSKEHSENYTLWIDEYDWIIPLTHKSDESLRHIFKELSNGEYDFIKEEDTAGWINSILNELDKRIKDSKKAIDAEKAIRYKIDNLLRPQYVNTYTNKLREQKRGLSTSTRQNAMRQGRIRRRGNINPHGH